MKCPRDDTPLQPFMVEARIQVDRCATCRGLWLDKGELEQIQETVERDHGTLDDAVGLAEGSFNQALQREAGPARCPRCSVEMELREYGYNSQVMIDACPDGCGVWLDDGELARLERFYERGRAEHTLPLRWRLWAGVVSVFKKGRGGKKA